MAITKFNVVNGLSVGDLVQIPVIDNTANVYANNLFVTGDSQLGNLATANYFSGTLVTSAQPNITSTGTLVSLNVSGNVSIGNNLVVDGNLTVSGTLVYENVETFAVEDPLIQLGGGPNGSPLTSNDGMDRGTLLHYYTTQTVDAFMGWDNSNAEFALGSNVSVANNVVTFNTYGNLRASSFLGASANITGNLIAGGIKSDNYYFANGQPFDFQQAAGANYQIQYNLGNDFAASPNFTFDGTTANIQGNLEVTNFAIAGNIYSDLLPQYTELQSIGTSTQRWKDIYLSGGTIYLGNTVLTANTTTNSLSTTNNFSVTGNLTVSNLSNLGDVANVRIFGGTDGYALKTYGNGNLYWGIDTTLAAGSNTQIQFNNNGPLGASANLTYDYATRVLTITGNITSGNANLGNLAVANYIQGTLTTGAQPNITSVGLLTELDIDGNLNVGGNFTVTGNFVYANVSSLSVNDPIIYLAANNVGDLDDIGIVGNWDDGIYQHGGIVRDHTDNTWKFFANVVAEPTNTVDWANATYAPVLMGNLTADTITANSANLGNLAYANYLQGTLITSAQPNITSVGTLTSLSVSGNITAGNLISNEAVKGANVYVNSMSSGQIAIAYTNGQLVGGPDLFWEFSNAALYTTALKVNTTITANGNITSLNANLGNLATANYFSGNGYFLTDLNVNSIGTVANANYAAYAGNVTLASQPNITSLGTLSSLTVSGSLTAGNISSTTGLLTLDTGTISVSGTDAGVFTVGISNVNVGMAGNVILGATSGQVTVRNNLYVANTATITNLKVNDFYSNRTPIAVTTNTVVDTFSVNKYRSAKYTMRVNSDDGYQAVEVLLIHDNSDSYVTIYGSLSTSGSDIITLSSDINSGQVRMLATTTSTNTTVNLLGTYVAD